MAGSLGASGVWCGSVWLSSHEDITPPEVKRKFLAASSSDTVRSRARTGKPARQLRSAWHDEWECPGSPDPLPMPLHPILVADAWNRIDQAAAAGVSRAERLESFFIGQVVGGFAELRPAEAIARCILRDYAERLEKLAARGLLTRPTESRVPSRTNRPHATLRNTGTNR
jgi:NAD(P)H-dependent flavin oxidoreductase YrpB (nitropropane dioxygenase family)